VSDRVSEVQVQQVVALARAVDHAAVVVSIDGRSGSGKTSLANAVAAELQDAAIVHLDDMYPGWDGLAATPPLLVAQVLEATRRGEATSFRRFDWVRGTFADAVAVPRAPFLIVEGAGSSVGMARRYADVRVWLEADSAIRKRRGLARDGDAYAPHWQRWADQEDAVFGADRTREHAHLVLRTDD
jgi:uridine kinase